MANETSPTPARVTYADGITPVEPGDRVSVRFFLRRRPGEVIYVPGISKRRSSYEHSGLTWVGVSLPDGWAIASLVLPETGHLQRSVRFLGRGSDSNEAAEAKRPLTHQEQEEEAARPEDPEEDPAAPIVRPKTTDSFAAAVALLFSWVSFSSSWGLFSTPCGCCASCSSGPGC